MGFFAQHTTVQSAPDGPGPADYLDAAIAAAEDLRDTVDVFEAEVLGASGIDCGKVRFYATYAYHWMRATVVGLDFPPPGPRPTSFAFRAQEGHEAGSIALLAASAIDHARTAREHVRCGAREAAAQSTLRSMELVERAEMLAAAHQPAPAGRQGGPAPRQPH